MDEEQIKDIKALIKEELRGSLSQSDFMPDIIKQRHVGEGVRYIRAGATTLKPTSGEKAGALFFDTTTNKLYIWTGSAWKEEEFT